MVKSPSARSDNLIFAYGEIPRAVQFATRITALMEGVVDTLTVNESRMWERLEEGYTQATDLAEFVMLRCGVDYRAAYLIVGEVVGAASRRGIRGVDISPEDLDVAAQRVIGRSLELEAEEVKAVLDPRAIVATRSALGGAAPEAVDAMTEEYLAKAVDLGYRAKRELEKYAAAEARLIAEAEQVAGDQHR